MLAPLLHELLLDSRCSGVSTARISARAESVMARSVGRCTFQNSSISARRRSRMASDLDRCSGVSSSRSSRFGRPLGWIRFSFGESLSRRPRASLLRPSARPPRT
jgi:hypothetical protein